MEHYNLVKNFEKNYKNIPYFCQPRSMESYGRIFMGENKNVIRNLFNEDLECYKKRDKFAALLLLYLDIKNNLGNIKLIFIEWILEDICESEYFEIKDNNIIYKPKDIGDNTQCFYCGNVWDGNAQCDCQMVEDYFL